MAYSSIRPKSQISNVGHDDALSIGNFMLMMKKLKNFESEPLHPKNVLIASVGHGISCLLRFNMMKKSTRPTSASDFFIFLDMKQLLSHFLYKTSKNLKLAKKSFVRVL
jgi:hypothetical protein